jgi:hypothetical protein
VAAMEVLREIGVEFAVGPAIGKPYAIEHSRQPARRA